MAQSESFDKQRASTAESSMTMLASSASFAVHHQAAPRLHQSEPHPTAVRRTQWFGTIYLTLRIYSSDAGSFEGTHGSTAGHIAGTLLQCPLDTRTAPRTEKASSVLSEGRTRPLQRHGQLRWFGDLRSRFVKVGSLGTLQSWQLRYRRTIERSAAGPKVPDIKRGQNPGVR